MSNMSYCRFRNTLMDLEDCRDNMEDSDMDKSEEEARKRLVKLCKDIAYEYDFLLDK